MSSAHHAPPPQQFSEEAADRGLIIALGIMGSAFFILFVAVLLSAFFLKAAGKDGLVANTTTAMIIYVICAFIPISFALGTLLKSPKNSSGH